MNLESICGSAVKAAQEAGHFIREERKKLAPGDVVKKGQRDLVSYVDVTAEKIIVERLQDVIPGAGFLTEEKTVNPAEAEWQWIIDPLDGTTNFIHGVPAFAVSVGLARGNELLAGVVYEINLSECFYAWKNGGAFLNGNKISVTGVTSMQDSLFATGFPYREFPHAGRFFDTLRYLFNNSHGVRRLGSAAVDLAYVACGRFDGFFEYNLNAWDVAAGALIVQEAGGLVTDFEGKDQYLFGKTIMASNLALHSEFLTAINHPIR